MIVIDASAMVELLLGTETGERIESRVFEGPASRHVPRLVDIEVLQVLRRLARSRAITAARASAAVEDLGVFPCKRHGHAALLDRGSNSGTT